MFLNNGHGRPDDAVYMKTRIFHVRHSILSVFANLLDCLWTKHINLIYRVRLDTEDWRAMVEKMVPV